MIPNLFQASVEAVDLDRGAELKRNRQACHESASESVSLEIVFCDEKCLANTRVRASGANVTNSATRRGDCAGGGKIDTGLAWIVNPLRCSSSSVASDCSIATMVTSPAARHQVVDTTTICTKALVRDVCRI